MIRPFMLKPPLTEADWDLEMDAAQQEANRRHGDRVKATAMSGAMCVAHFVERDLPRNGTPADNLRSLANTLESLKRTEWLQNIVCEAPQVLLPPFYETLGQWWGHPVYLDHVQQHGPAIYGFGDRLW